MTPIQICRACLAHDTRMYTVVNTNLGFFNENITNLILNTDDGRPSVVCYICYHLLKKCSRFAESVIRANKMLEQLYKAKSQITKQHVSSLNNRILLTFCKTQVTNVNAMDVSDGLEIGSVQNGNINIKSHNEQENIAVDATEFSEDIYLEQKVTMQYEIIKQEYDHPQYDIQSSFSNVSVPQITSARKKNDIRIVCNEVEKCGQRAEGAPGLAKREMLPNKTPKIIKQKFTPIDIVENKKLVYNKKSKSNSKVPQPYTCDICGKSFNLKCNMKRHILTIHNEMAAPIAAPTTRSKCHQCGKKFKDNFTLGTHLRTHTNEKPFSCNSCSKSFSQKSNLVRHLRIHSGDKPYSCSFCNKKFAQKNDLTLHIRNHTGERPYACNFCNEKYKQIGLLKNHVSKCHTHH